MGDSIRVGIIGIGGIGLHHAQYLADGQVESAILTAVSARDPERRAAALQKFPEITVFPTHSELLRSRQCDVVLICTPHYQHVPIALEAFAAGMHVLVEKPLAVSLSEARRAVTASQEHPHLLFGIMLNQRANPLFQKLRQILLSGEFGQITRITWIATQWFRPWSYYANSPWRATWKGEGGGVLINQCHHNLDLLHWTTGLMPSRITAVGFTGKYHPIEAEDEVSAILEYPSPDGIAPGPIAHFITSTAEAPGTNRLEIATTRGKIIAENGQLELTRTSADLRDFLKSHPEPFGSPKSTRELISLPAPITPEHKAITQDFIDAIREKRESTSLLASAASDLPAMELSNAMLLAAITRHPVTLPLDAGAFDAFLEKMKRS